MFDATAGLGDALECAVHQHQDQAVRIFGGDATVD
jgi:hypothetical protein